MKLSITPSETYPSHELEIADWLAEKKEFLNQFKSQISIVRQTEKAFQIRLEKSGEEYWLPKSQCKIIKRMIIKRMEQKLSNF
jgi:hypothetical protein